MSARLIQNFLIVFACLAFGAGLFAAETNATVSALPPDAVNGFLQIQQQLHDAQLAIENNRRQAETEARRNADDMAAKIESLQQIIAAQRQGEIESAQKTQQLILILGGTFVVVGLAVLLLMAWLQWRAVSRLVELSALPARAVALNGSRSLPLPETVAEIAAPARAAVEASNTRLFGAVERLEKRILEMEHAARKPLAETSAPVSHQSNGSAATPAPVPPAPRPASSDDREECVANLLSEGQALLTANEPQKALECFDVALGLHPQHAEALVKKGSALEKLGQFDDAVACYNQAIEADGAMTIAYLHKGGLFNRLARYDEALQCYEQALRTQEKKAPAAEPAAA